MLSIQALKTKAMDMRRAQEPRAEAAIRNNDYAAQELNAAHPLPPGNLAEMAVASPLTSMALADWKRGRDASRSTGGAGRTVPELVERMLGAKQDSGGWPSAEDELVRTSVQRLGCVWSLIAAALPGRSDGAVHSRWNRLEAMRLEAVHNEPAGRRFKSTLPHQVHYSSAGLYQHKHAARPPLIKWRKAEEEEESPPPHPQEGPLLGQPYAGLPAGTSMPPFEPLAAPAMRLQEVRPPVVRVWSCSKGCGETFTHGRTAAWSKRRQHEETCMGGGDAPQWRNPSTEASTEASTAASAAAASTAAERADAAAGATKENVAMQRAPAAAACPSHASKRAASRPKLQAKLQAKLPPKKQPRLGGLACSAASARRPLQAIAGFTANAGPSTPVEIKEWVASHNLEISRTHPDGEDSAWDYIGHRFPRERSPGTAVHSTVLTEGRWAVEFTVLECKGNSGNGMYIGVTDGDASLTQEKGGRA